ncbi:hypothetical protein [Microbulbifer sp. THAF38]|uniref:hypothetical protein n=1 Tax=Microbulbifer sp. THAF38 TaxID=2587856 RepID=UPI0012682F08|nr:hypothetical protein [Microbulbifer sp. THAF38]QFT55602.1 hypothetical protein FIU95_13690 [Microbulbifer sp. THAF38]
MDINEIRRTNIRRIAADYKNRAEFARKVDRSEQQLYSLISKGATKTIGNRIARDLEEKLGLKEGELDRLESSNDSTSKIASDIDLELLRKCIDAIEVEIEKQGLQGIPSSKKAQAIALAYGATRAGSNDDVVPVGFIINALF